MIREVASTAHYYYVLTDKALQQIHIDTGQKVEWDMPSIPCSPLLLSSANETHWSIVCVNHLRTHEVTVPHSFAFLPEDARQPTFVSMHEIGVCTGEGEEKCGIRLVHCNRTVQNSEVYQDGDHVQVRRTLRNGFMQVIPQSRLLVSDPKHGILVERGPTHRLMSYDVYGLHGKELGPLKAWDPPALRCCMIGPHAVVLANDAFPGSLRILDQRWHFFFYVKWLVLLWVAYNVLCVLLSVG